MALRQVRWGVSAAAAATAAFQHAAYEHLRHVSNIKRDIDLFLSVI